MSGFGPRFAPMTTTWQEFSAVAPRIAEVFTRRHGATGNLCMLGTLRPDGFPRISPMEPRFFEGQLWIGGMPGTAKFRDLVRDPRFCLHTATVDTHVSEGDAKVWGVVEDVQDPDLHQRYAVALYEETGFDLRGREFEHFFAAHLTGASAVAVGGGHMDVTVWREGTEERVVRKH
jgi:hypothetical protein